MRLWGWLQKRCALRAWYYVLPGVKCIVSGESVLCVCIGECGAILPIRAIGVAQRQTRRGECGPRPPRDGGGRGPHGQDVMRASRFPETMLSRFAPPATIIYRPGLPAAARAADHHLINTP